MASISDLGIDLGTSNVLIYVRDRGIVLNEPAVVAMDRDTRSIRAIGTEAKRMIGRAPSGIVVMRPLGEGAVADLEIASTMLHYFVRQVVGKRVFFARPRAALSLPANVNENEKRTFASILLESGVRRTRMLDRPLAAAIGASMNINAAYGAMVVDIGAGMTDIAVISTGTVRVANAVRIGGDTFNDAIARYLRRKHNFLIGECTAEELKIGIASAIPRRDPMSLEVTGRDLISGLPKLIRVDGDEVYEAIDDPLNALIDAIHGVLEHVPAELASDLPETGIMLTGGGALLAGLPEAISAALNIECRVAENPQICVATGCGWALEKAEEFGRYLHDWRRR